MAAAEQQRLLDALGPKPGDSELAENERVATVRTAIQRDLGHFDERRKRSELILVRIDLLLVRMAEAEFQALKGVLTERTVLSLAPATGLCVELGDDVMKVATYRGG